MSATPEIDFSRLAPRYDELRNTGKFWGELVEEVVREGDLKGRRVLDVGCGTGKWATVLAERYGCKVWGVDPSPEMIEVARDAYRRASGCGPLARRTSGSRTAGSSAC